ncbi:MAG TPA: hypothetical protein VMU33_08995 [Burkholderiaceae bacterium]|nr:hypothetical protein [Burkholderiaceae bacterium]
METPQSKSQETERGADALDTLARARAEDGMRQAMFLADLTLTAARRARARIGGLAGLLWHGSEPGSGA